MISKDNWSSLDSNQQYKPNSPQIFNTSFYAEKSVGESFTSLEYLMKYLSDTGLSQFENIMRSLLGSNQLPENPFNHIFRQLYIDALYQNLRLYFKLNPRHQLALSSKNSSNTLYNSLVLKEHQVFCSSKLGALVNIQYAGIAYDLVHSQLANQIAKNLKKKHGFKQEFRSFGGPFVLDLVGTQNSSDGYFTRPSKTSLLGNVYTCSSMLQITQYLLSIEEQTKSLQMLSEYILDDSIELMQYSDDHYRIFLLKMEILAYGEEDEKLREFNREQLIHHRSQLAKSIRKGMEETNLLVQYRCVFQLSSETAAVVGEQYLTVVKKYVLITQHENEFKVYSQEPVTNALRQIFTTDSYLRMACPICTSLFAMCEQAKKEALPRLTLQIKMQNITSLCWEILYLVIFEEEKGEFIHEKVAICYILSKMMNSPICLVHQMIHLLKCAKWTLSPKFPSVSQHQTHILIAKLDQLVTTALYSRSFVLWEAKINFQGIKKLLSILLEDKLLKINAITHVIELMSDICNGLVCGYEQVVYAMTDSLHAYLQSITNIDNLQSARSLKLQPRIVVKTTITEQTMRYDLLSKQKLPALKQIDVTKTLSLPRNSSAFPEDTLRKIIIAKYIKNYDLYKCIYQFYWQLICEKKVHYPLTELLGVVLQQAIKYESFPFQETSTVDVNVVNGRQIYEVTESDSGIVLYSLDKDNLKVSTMKSHKLTADTFRKYFQQELQPAAEGFGFQGKLQTLNPNNSNKVRVLMSFKRISHEDSLGECNSVKVFADIIFKQQVKVGQLHSACYEYISKLLAGIDKDGLIIIGVFASSQLKGFSMGYDEDEAFSKLIEDDHSFIRYDYKKMFSIDKLVRLMEHCKSMNKRMEIRLLYPLDDKVKTARIEMNYYHLPEKSMMNSQSQFVSFLPVNNRHQRLFISKMDLIEWQQINRDQLLSSSAYRPKQKVNPSTLNKQTSTKLHQRPPKSLKRLREDQQVSLLQLIDGNSQFSSYSLKHKSRYAVLLEYSHQLSVNMHYQIQALKYDRRGRSDITHLSKTHKQLSHYLFDQCLRCYSYVFSEGISICLMNLMAEVGRYLQGHGDNVGEEIELLHLEKIVAKLSSRIRFAQLSCAIYYHWAQGQLQHTQKR